MALAYFSSTLYTLSKFYIGNAIFLGHPIVSSEMGCPFCWACNSHFDLENFVRIFTYYLYMLVPKTSPFLFVPSSFNHKLFFRSSIDFPYILFHEWPLDGLNTGNSKAGCCCFFVCICATWRFWIRILDRMIYEGEEFDSSADILADYNVGL